ncbi:hypothetical protein EJ03DRAFT_329254 [Teratosphaeria nubilosa]|uniref:Uncharacterized protein n=1 Tax=Teratosphaeria nubilosa TaxID=161662 RepID=A0A6G1L3A4_9PEZI|nr:hypothetical protein EJ03DRAFT_329254 [Teratosphaeria nubilosa]
MSSQQPQQSTFSGNFIRGAGEVQDKRLWGPAKWVVQMIQYLIAIIMITMGEGIKAIFTGEKPKSRGQVKEEARKET